MTWKIAHNFPICNSIFEVVDDWNPFIDFFDKFLHQSLRPDHREDHCRSLDVSVEFGCAFLKLMRLDSFEDVRGLDVVPVFPDEHFCHIELFFFGHDDEVFVIFELLEVVLDEVRKFVF